MKPKTNIKDIPTRKYEGYIWLSNEENPIILPEEEFDFSSVKENDNPFIVEALLYFKDDNEEVSIIIKHTGKYHIHEIDLKKYSDENFVDVKYLPHRLGNVEKVNFKQLWLPKPDENCEGMEVLQMKALVFTGFELKN